MLLSGNVNVVQYLRKETSNCPSVANTFYHIKIYPVNHERNFIYGR